MVVTEKHARNRKLGDLLAGLVPSEWLAAHAELAVAGVADDSRRVRAGEMFVAVRGTALDGRRFVEDAIERGATVVVGEELPPSAQPLIVNVPDARVALASIAQRWYEVQGAGGGKIELIGVTGTNGKSTTAFMTHAILRAAGKRCGLLGTVQYDLCDRLVGAEMTTPGALDLAAYLRECIDAGAEAAVLEVSSHALDQQRTAGLHFSAAAFTNLSGDHLDYHGTFEEYRAAKARLFTGLAPDAVALINADDPHHGHMLAGCPARVVTYALERTADIRAVIMRSSAAGTHYRLRIDGRELVLENGVVGRHNVYNAMAAAGLARALGVEHDAIAAGLLAVRNVPGRLQRLQCDADADVFVDYAHTDDALRNALSVLRPLAQRRLIVVFGCGGERDKTKRPRMAQAAAQFADSIVVTSDNPRAEDPDAIIAEVMYGFETSDRARVRVEPDRACAIHAALAMADKGDIVLLAGKGHEDYQIIGTRRIHFDDAEVAIQTAAELRRGGGGAV